MPITKFEFEELQFLPPVNGFEAHALIDGVAYVDYGRASRNWVISAVDVRYSKIGPQQKMLACLYPAPFNMVPALIQQLSQPKWRQAIQEHVDQVAADDAEDAKAEAQERRQGALE